DEVSRSAKRRKNRVTPDLQGEWRGKLDKLKLNAPGKYFSFSPRFKRDPSGAGKIAKSYGCLWQDPYNTTQCWRRKHETQPVEWLNTLGRKEKGFFPRSEAEMLRHLAVHRRVERLAAKNVPGLADLATAWQDRLIDEQLIKDRDDPDKQGWEPGELRKSREEIDDQLAVSSCHQR
ncbi:hypothetical protein RSAG8_08534, partial [Rhizoctonia solani AG-8 WAC10335]